MIHPSYSELMQVVNKDTEIDEPPVVNSRYSIVLATSKRARQIIGGDTPLVPYVSGKKPLSVAIDELYQGKVKIVTEDRKDKEELSELEPLIQEELLEEEEELLLEEADASMEEASMSMEELPKQPPSEEEEL